jgi:hypothetical protein
MRRALQQRIGPTVASSLDHWHSSSLVPFNLREAVEHIEERQQFFRQELTALVKESGIPAKKILFLKGKAIEQWYPHSYLRYCFDIDLVAEDPVIFWQLCVWLVDRGYEVPALGAAYADRTSPGNWKFLLSCEKPFAADPDQRIRLAVFELLDGITSMTASHYFDLEPFFQRARANVNSSLEQIDPWRSFFLYPTREDCLLMLLIEISERKLHLRDALDFFFLLVDAQNNSGDVNWTLLASQIEAESLEPQFLRLADLFTALSGEMLPSPMQETQKRWRRRLSCWKVFSRSPVLNCVVPAVARRSGWRAALREVFSNAKVAGRNIVGNTLSLPTYASTLSKQAFVRLLLVSSELRGPYQLGVGRGDEAFIRTPIGVFLISRNTVFREKFLHALPANFPANWATVSNSR